MKVYEDKVVYEADAGQFINDYINEAICIAKKYLKPVECCFNGVAFNCYADSEFSKVHTVFNTLLKEKQNAYRQTDEYKKQKIINDTIKKQNQERMEVLLNNFVEVTPTTINQEFIDWLFEFSNLSDYTYIKFDPESIVEKLILCGFSDNAFLDLPKECYDDVYILNHYVVGQVISGLIRHGSVVPIATHFIKQMRPL